MAAPTLAGMFQSPASDPSAQYAGLTYHAPDPGSGTGAYYSDASGNAMTQSFDSGTAGLIKVGGNDGTWQLDPNFNPSQVQPWQNTAVNNGQDYLQKNLATGQTVDQARDTGGNMWNLVGTVGLGALAMYGGAALAGAGAAGGGAAAGGAAGGTDVASTAGVVGSAGAGAGTDAGITEAGLGASGGLSTTQIGTGMKAGGYVANATGNKDLGSALNIGGNALSGNYVQAGLGVAGATGMMPQTGVSQPQQASGGTQPQTTGINTPNSFTNPDGSINYGGAIAGGLGALYSTAANNNIGSSLQGMYGTAQGQAAPFNSALSQLYANPNSYFSSPLYQSQANLYGDQVMRGKNASGTASNNIDYAQKMQYPLATAE